MCFIRFRGRMAIYLYVFLLCPGIFVFDNTSTFAAQTLPDTTSGSAEYIVGLGDILEIQVWKEPDLSRNPAPVRIDGRISLPLLGDVMAAGKSISELTNELEKKYREVVNEPSVSVMLLQNRSWRYYIIGQIAQPGEFTIDYPINILQAIARSGGFNEWAKTSKVAILRKKGAQEIMLNFDYEALVKGTNINQNVLIAPGDTIIVP